MLNGMYEAKTTEAFAVEEGILLARERGLNQVVIELDSLLVVQAINTNSNMGELGSIIQGIIGFLRTFGSWNSKHLKREFNRAAHELAQLAKVAGAIQSWEGIDPPLLQSLLIFDRAKCWFIILSPLCCTSISDSVNEN